MQVPSPFRAHFFSFARRPARGAPSITAAIIPTPQITIGMEKKVSTATQVEGIKIGVDQPMRYPNSTQRKTTNLQEN
jgi:hypothetical protein